jgi:hypothetical protein
MATGPEHYREAEKLAAQADEWLNADYGWKGNLTAAERLAYRNSDLAAAQVHATLALAAAAGLSGHVPGTGMLMPDKTEWYSVASRAKLNKDAERAELAELAAEHKDGAL